MKLDKVTDKELGQFATNILDKTHAAVGYDIGGFHIMLQAFARTRPNDLRTLLRVITEECK